MKYIYKLNLTRIVFLCIFSAVCYHIWYAHLNYRFSSISENKVYKSGLIPPNKLESYLTKHKIKTVVNLLHPSIQDELNPATQNEIEQEITAIKRFNKKNNTSIAHINIQSDQVPTQKNIDEFLQLLDNKDNYPVLIHCYHGVGRAELYSALYRIEYEQWDNSDARNKARLIVAGLGYESSFADSKPKGQFLLTYVPRWKDKIN